MSSLSPCCFCKSIDQQIRDLEPDGTVMKVIANLPIVADVVLRIKYAQLSNDFNQAYEEFRNHPSILSEKKAVKIGNDMAHLAKTFSQWGTIQRIVLLVATMVLAPPLLSSNLIMGITFYIVGSSLHCIFNTFSTFIQLSKLSDVQVQFLRRV